MQNAGCGALARGWVRSVSLSAPAPPKSTPSHSWHYAPKSNTCADQQSMELSVCQGLDGIGRADDLGEMKWQTACSPGLSPKGRGDLREVAAEFRLAAAGPVEAVEGSLHQRCHDAAQAGLICTAVPLTVMLHAEPRGLEDDRESAESCSGSSPLGG